MILSSSSKDQIYLLNYTCLFTVVNCCVYQFAIFDLFLDSMPAMFPGLALVLRWLVKSSKV